jgi:hypothetical protein
MQLPSLTQRIEPAIVRFEIRFALGQAGASIYADIASKSPERRLRGLDALAGLVAIRFDPFVIYGPGPIAGPSGQ